MDDSTVAVEVAAAQALLHWRFHTDVSLIYQGYVSAIASVFVQPKVRPDAGPLLSPHCPTGPSCVLCAGVCL